MLVSMAPKDGPDSLAEAVALGHGACPIPATHDRLDECHYWWHQMADQYHEPPYFRWSFGAFITAARSLTFMLQSEKANLQDFDQWYGAWQDNARESPTLGWLNESRRILTHRSALSTKSWARFRCLFEQVDPSYVADEEEDLYLHLNPFKCTHAYIREGFVENHGHEYQRSWEVAELPDRELLEVCAEIYDVMADLVDTAHVQAGGSGMSTVRRDPRDGQLIAVPHTGHHLPCMNNTESYRTVQTYIKDGAEVWEDSPGHV